MESKDIYDSYLKKENNPTSIAGGETCSKVGGNNVGAETSPESPTNVTLPPSCAFTPETEEYDGGYNDILNLMERLENETKKEEDNDSGRPQSGQSSSICPSSKTSPKRASSSMAPPPPSVKRTVTSTEKSSKLR